MVCCISMRAESISVMISSLRVKWSWTALSKVANVEGELINREDKSLHDSSIDKKKNAQMQILLLES